MVEDDPMICIVAEDMLLEAGCRAGYQVVEASDAGSALRILEERSDIRVLFTDIQMPGQCDGMKLAAKVHERWPNVLLIVTSGRLNIADEDVPDHGCFVAKPYPDQALVGQVTRLIADQEARARR